MGQAKNSGYIKLFRKITTWEWYSDPATRDLFIHCLLKANWEPGVWRGHPYKRGEFFTSYRKLAEETGFSLQHTRTALKRLQETQSLTLFSTSKYTLISICNYDEYQESDTVSNKQKAHTATHRATTDKEEKKRRIEKVSLMQTDREELEAELGAERLEGLLEDVRLWAETSGAEVGNLPARIRQFARRQDRDAATAKPQRRKSKSTEDLIRELQAEEEQQ